MEDEESNSSASFKFVPYVETTKPFEMSDFYKYSTKFKKSKNGSESSSTSSNDNNNKPPGTITKIYFFLFQIVCNIKRNVLQNCQRKIHLPNQHQHHLLHQRIWKILSTDRRPVWQIRFQVKCCNGSRVNKTTLEHEVPKTARQIMNPMLPSPIMTNQPLWFDSTGFLLKKTLFSQKHVRTCISKEFWETCQHIQKTQWWTKLSSLLLKGGFVVSY